MVGVGGLIAAVALVVSTSTEPAPVVASRPSPAPSTKPTERPPVQAASTKAPSKKAILELEATPRSTILVDGKDKGLSPITLELDGGSYRVEARAAGYETASKTVVVGAGDDKSVSLVLTRRSPVALEATSAKSSSYLTDTTAKGTDTKIKYTRAANAIDGNPYYTWCEGVSGTGMGESLTVTWDCDSWVSSIGIHPGHYNSQKSWDGNNIVTRAHVTVSSNGKVLNDQSHSFSGGRGEVQTIPVDADCSDHVTATFEIEQVRRGYYQSTNDTCIGDVFAYGL